MTKILRSFLPGIVAMAAIQVSHADVTYFLVTEEYQLDFQSRYLIVAKDYDVMAGECTNAGDGKWGLAVVDITRNSDNSIVIEGDVANYKNSRFYLRDKISKYSDEYCWELHNENGGDILRPLGSGALGYGAQATSYLYKELQFKFMSDGSVQMSYPPGVPNFICYAPSLKRFKCAKKNELEAVCLYREDWFGFKIDSSYESEDDIRLTSLWVPQEHFLKTPLEIKYIFNDGAKVTKDQLMTDGQSIKTNDGTKISIPRSEEGDVLWVLGVYEARYNDNGNDLGNEYYRYSHVVSFDVPKPEKKITTSEHFIQPKSDGYAFMEEVVFSKDSDVKIYYTIDGSTPVIPADENSMGQIYDADTTPIIYYGDEINLKFIAVKEGYEPTEVISLTLTGEPKPVTTENVHFKKPVERKYEIGELILFERDPDVKIYYTLDGLDPVIPGSETNQPEAESDEPEDESHYEKTYDLDERPLKYEGEEFTVKYLAIKQHYAPSPVYLFEVKLDTSGINDVVADDNDNQPVMFYNIQGTPVAPPLRPGLYIMKKGTKASKIVIR